MYRPQKIFNSPNIIYSGDQKYILLEPQIISARLMSARKKRKKKIITTKKRRYLRTHCIRIAVNALSNVL